MGQSQSTDAVIQAITNIMVNETASNIATNALTSVNKAKVNIVAIHGSHVHDIDISQSQKINWSTVQQSTNSINSSADIQNKLSADITQKVMDWSIGQVQSVDIQETVSSNIRENFDIKTIMQNAVKSENDIDINIYAIDSSEVDHVSAHQVGEVVFDAAQKCATSMVTDLKLTNDVHFKDVQDTKSGLGSIISAALTAMIMPLIIIAIVVVLLMVMGGGIKGVAGKMAQNPNVQAAAAAYGSSKGIDPAITQQALQGVGESLGK